MGGGESHSPVALLMNDFPQTPVAHLLGSLVVDLLKIAALAVPLCFKFSAQLSLLRNV